jgi:hypothetical protein
MSDGRGIWLSRKEGFALMETNERDRWAEEPPHELDGLPKHVIRKLVAANIATVHQVCDAGPTGLRKVGGIGVQAIGEIKVWPRERLRPDSPT